MGYQFIHMEAYARKADTKGRDVSFVIAEASRRSDASIHVSSPLRPKIVHGIGLEELQQLHDSAVASALTEVAGGKQRKLRQDQKTLHTVVASHPATMDEIRDDPEVRKAAEDWENRTIDWLRQQYGDDLMSIVRHEDESHFHIHAYILPLSDPSLKASRYHPGYSAKRAIMDAGALDDEDSKALGKRADAAYKAAMRQWQDSYHDAVAIPCGLTRLGPQRRRLTRDEWQREQAQARALQKTVDRAAVVKEQGKNYIEKTKTEAAKITMAAQNEMEAAKQATAAASRVRQQAAQEKQEAESIMGDAVQYVGLAGKFRAAWDRFRESELIQKIQQQFQREIDHWRGKAREAEEKRIEAERKLHEAEKRERAAREETLRATAERDRLRSMLPKSEKSEPAIAHDRSLKLEMKPTFSKHKEERQS